MKKKILVINNSSKLSGAEFSLLALLNELKNDYTFVIALPGDGDFHQKLTSLRYEVLCFNMLRLAKKDNILTKFKCLLTVLTTSFYISSYIRRNDIRLVYLNSNQSAVYAILIKFLTRCKIVWHVRDSIRNVAIAKILGFNATEIICVSQYIYDQIPVSEQKKQLIYNGIDTQQWMPTQPLVSESVNCLLDKDMIVGQVGQLIPWKNHLDLLRVIELVLKEIKNVHFLIVGDDLFDQNQEYVNQIRDAISNKGLNQYISLTGNREDIISCMNELDVLIHCAVDEPFGRVVLEAMALEKPVVAYYAGGVRELVEDHVTGALAPAGNYELLAKKLISLLKNKQLRNYYGHHGRLRVIEKFTINKHADLVRRLIDKLI